MRAGPSDPEVHNRVYYRIWNDGSVTLQNAAVKVSYAAPGIGQTNWTPLGTAPVSATAPGGSFTGYFDWVVPDAFNAGTPHVCIKVEINPNGPDLNATNNDAQENVFEFETVHTSPWHARAQIITVTNPDQVADADIDMDVLELPTGWAVRMLPTHFLLKAGTSKKVDFVIYSGGPPTRPTTGYDAGFVAKTKLLARAYYGGKLPRQTILGGIEVRTRLTEGTKNTLVVTKISAGRASLSACLKSDFGPVRNAVLSIYYWNSNSSSTRYGTADLNGCTAISLTDLAAGLWNARSLYAGRGPNGSSASKSVKFDVPARN